ncbi:Protein ASPARTIC PROTEASE IN GUARD CELL 1 [Morella rubra]|uniref:Protein ASPARTIC PROTEASE IN GUARD CELL 1 n=1 Tax=Morella rubra TaxID=262757 RepID=A0A6A1VL45_9ROSI|nr:Protein ASPARTIC PROTEASE IN GUARD CELL 1 [Morella rubra]
MAQSPFLFCFTAFVALAVSFFPLAFSRSLSEGTHSFLDVSASLKQAHAVLNFDPEKLKPLDQHEELQPQSFANSSSFVVQLHPRNSLYKTSHKDYKSLVLSRLERDSARVKSLTTELQLALSGLKKSDLEPMEAEVLPESLSTPIVSGTSQGSGEYFSRVGVGHPAKPFYMVLDTGSDLNWLQCKPCTDCYQQSDPIFDPSSSSSYEALSCTSPQCGSLDVSGCRAEKCLYQVSYGDGSFTVGDFVTETLSFWNSGGVSKVALGCGHDNEGLFVGAAGLLGLGGGSLSLPSQIKASSFSYCLVDRDSGRSSTLEFNSAPPADSVSTALLRNRKIGTFYYVGLTGMSVGGQPLSIPSSVFQMDASGNGGIIVDSGTAITRLQTQAYNALRDAFVQLTRHLPTTSGVALFDTCYDLSSMRSVRVPTVSFRFSDDKTLLLPAKNYLIPVDSSGTFCFAFAPTTSSLSIIGNVQQQGTRVSFDLANSRVGFSPNKC